MTVGWYVDMGHSAHKVLAGQVGEADTTVGFRNSVCVS